ncbi:PKD domain-containing protein [Branchiibius hedensis]|uniref:PKD domain-containing protein n=1 Tax=Branchiibius hedensis TaxID=672460 RepID=A0A2Y9BUV5_9MICO|nr:PKD domain-containing protein [Branchiibius hedensis]PWJ27522.1 PKD domain-containing protein [Branchiibius hedensis]SSA36332.1 PKD domain-containing protein [Branchiibius hedensis]
MSFSFVGSTTATASSGSSVTITRSVTAGNLLVASILHQGGAISTVTDTASNTWATDSNGDTQTINSSTSQRRVQHYWCLSALTTASITVTIAGTAPFVVILSEYSHSGGAVTLRSVATAAGSTTTTPAATPSGTAVGDLLVGCMGYAQTTAGTRLDTLGSGYTELTGTNISTTRLSGAYRTLTAAGQAGPQWTMTSGTTGSSSVAFYEYVTPPVASFTKTATNLALSVDGTASTAGTGTISGYDWDWGDSTTHGTGSTASHTYASPGTYTVKLTVTNSAGGTASTTQSVTVSTSDIVLMSDTTATSGTASLTITKSTTAGRALVLAILHQGGSVTSVTDTAGNTWVTSANADTQASQESTSQRRVTHYWCVGAAAVTSVTIAAAGSVLLGSSPNGPTWQRCGARSPHPPRPRHPRPLQRPPSSPGTSWSAASGTSKRPPGHGRTFSGPGGPN